MEQRKFEGRQRDRRWGRLPWALVAALALALAPVACGDDDDDDDGNGTPPPTGEVDAATPPPAGEDAAVAAGPITNDSQVVQAMLVANDAEVVMGQQAKTRASHPDVVEYADRMILEHGAANVNLNALVNQLALKPAESDVSQELRNEADQIQRNLQTAQSFDLAYLESQVVYHTSVLDALNTELIPKAKDQRLRLELMNQRMDVENHRAVAQALIVQLTGVTPDGGLPPPPPPPVDAGTTGPGDAGVITP